MRAMRLRRTKDIDLVRSGGDVRTDPLFTTRSRRTREDVVRLAVGAPKSLGGATRRNRARRRVREAFRAILAGHERIAGTDLLVTARAPAADAPFERLRAAAARALEAYSDPRSARRGDE